MKTLSRRSKEKMIKSLTADILKAAHAAMQKKIDRAINSGAIDIDSWDQHTNPMIIPKIIAIAIMEDEAGQYKGRGTSFEKEVKKEVTNLKFFL